MLDDDGLATMLVAPQRLPAPSLREVEHVHAGERTLVLAFHAGSPGNVRSSPAGSGSR